MFQFFKDLLNYFKRPTAYPAPQKPIKRVITGSDPDEGTPPWYREAFYQCTVDLGCEDMLKSSIAMIERGLQNYVNVSKKLGAKDIGLFAYILGVIHFKEASCNFKGVLHNGEQIIGTKKLTVKVPAGRGPFNSWDEAAIDAILLKINQWKPLIEGTNDIGLILGVIEKFNGQGYIKGLGSSETSPYLWACSNINDGRGVYTYDHFFNPLANADNTPGAALILKELYKQNKIILKV